MVKPRSSNIEVRQATATDVPQMVESRSGDLDAGPADPRMAAYLDGRHHPQRALAPRIAYLATVGGEVVGYIAGHLTRRYDCEGELQYLYVAPAYRRTGVATTLLRHLAEWFQEQGATRICVDVNDDSPSARPFYIRYGAQQLRPHWLVWPDIRSLVAGRR
jgi:GNAT superfamily N-acetyltransferase